MSPRTTVRTLIAVAMLPLGWAGSDPSAAQMMRPCVHTYNSGIVVVAAARSAGGAAAALPTVALGGFKVNGQPVNPSDLQQLHNATPSGEGLACTLPCSFGVEEGKWQFTAGAAGHAAKVVSVDARYAEFVGGCPSYNDKGTEVRLVLEPAAAR
jgi:hypothetical protein